MFFFFISSNFLIHKDRTRCTMHSAHCTLYALMHDALRCISHKMYLSLSWTFIRKVGRQSVSTFHFLLSAIYVYLISVRMHTYFTPKKKTSKPNGREWMNFDWKLDPMLNIKIIKLLNVDDMVCLRAALSMHIISVFLWSYIFSLIFFL